MNFSELIIWIKELFVIGGAVMFPLVLCTLLLWYGVGYRFWVMKDPKLMGVRDMVKLYQQHHDKPDLRISIQCLQFKMQLSGAFMAALIAIETFLNIVLYLRDNVLHVK